MGWGVSTIVKDNFGLVDSMEQYHNNAVLDNFNLQLLLTTQTIRAKSSQQMWMHV